MTAPSDNFLKVFPYVIGARTSGHCVVRLASAPRYLTLSTAEMIALQELALKPCSTVEFLGRYLGQARVRHGLDFRSATKLVVNLYRHGFVDDPSGEMAARLENQCMDGTLESSRMRRLSAHFRAILDPRVVEFLEVVPHPALTQGVRLLAGPWYFFALATLTTILCGVTFPRVRQLMTPLAELLRQPTTLLGWSLLGIAVASSSIAVIRLLILRALGARFVAGSIRLTSFLLPRFALVDDDAVMLPKDARRTYFATSLLLPWILAAIFLIGLHSQAGNKFLSLMAGVCALLGVVELCPLVRSTLVRFAESELATVGLLYRLGEHLHRGIFTSARDAFRADQSKTTKPTSKTEDQNFQTWLVSLVSWSMLWLYFAMLGTADLLSDAVPALWTAVQHFTHDRWNGLAAIILLIFIGLFLVGVVARLMMIPLNNVAAIAAVPLQRARRSLGSFRDKKAEPSAALMDFITSIPLFSDLSDETVNDLIPLLHYRHYRRGEWIVRQGEVGQEFFILSDGQAEVLLEPSAAPVQILDVLGPGDSFGEIALIEHTRRTASIRATTLARVLTLEKSVFDRLYPEKSERRDNLTLMIRRMKLLVESKALSHLAPRQIRQLLTHAKEVKFDPDQYLMREGDEGNSAFLLVDGHVSVFKEKDKKQLTVLGRGELVGATALLKQVRRTASVCAMVSTTALEIDKEVFLKLCMSNVFVALLLSDQADKQMAEMTELDPEKAG